MQGVIDASDVPVCAASALCLYDRYRPAIADIRTADERDAVLSQMKERFEWYLQHEPENAEQLTEIYQLLRRKCLQALG